MQIHVNQQVEDMLCLYEQTEELEERELSALLQKKGNTAITQAAIAGYLAGLIDAGAAAGISLDLTYETVKQLPAALKALYHVQAGEYRPADNTVLIGKAIAAYAMCLCAVAEDTPIVFSYCITPVMSRTAVLEVLDRTLGGSTALVGTKRKMDFYQAGTLCVKDLPGFNGILAVDFTPLVDAFYQATGVDLSKHGLPAVCMLKP